MGAQQSTRRISVENDEPALITVSSSVVERLNNSSISAPPHQAVTEEPDEKPIRGRPPYGSKVRKLDINSFEHAGNELKYKGLPYVTTREIQQALDEEIQKNSEYWEKRLARQREIHEKMNKALEEEYVKASEQMDKYLPRGSPNGKKKVDCEVKSKRVLNCLQMNKQHPLVCSKEVEAFNSCVLSARNQVV